MRLTACMLFVLGTVSPALAEEAAPAAPTASAAPAPPPPPPPAPEIFNNGPVECKFEVYGGFFGEILDAALCPDAAPPR